MVAQTMFGQKLRGQGDWLTALQGDGLTAACLGGCGHAQGDWLTAKTTSVKPNFENLTFT